MIHAGKLLKSKIDELNVNTTELAEYLDISRQNLYPKFQNDDLPAGFLAKCSAFINYDLLKHYTQPELPFADSKGKEDIIRLQTEVKILREQNRHLMRILKVRLNEQ